MTEKQKQPAVSSPAQQPTAAATEQDAYSGALAYFRGDTLAAKVWASKYALRDENGVFLETSPDQMHRRMAKELARVEAKYPNPLSEAKIYQLLQGFARLVPQGSPMFGIGNTHQIVSLSNCFVVGNEADSYGGVMATDEQQAHLMKRRGGVGHDLSHIRPAGTKVLNSARTSTGVVPFMERFSNTTREVAQEGRRGALMLTISIKHPDAEHFIDAKMEQGKVTGANISVRLTDDFMEAVKAGTMFVQEFPIGAANPLVRKEVDARKLWGKIIHNAWKSAEPGIMFWDKIIAESPADCYAEYGFRTVSTNPCGEIPLCEFDSCRLLAINLTGYVRNPFTNNAEFDFAMFWEDAVMAMRLMDDIVDLELEKIDAILAKIGQDPEDENIKQRERALWLSIREKAVQGRRTGLGITGEGDMLAMLGKRYASEAANDFAESIQKHIASAALCSSVVMAEERGAFPLWDYEKEKNNPFLQRVMAEWPDSMLKKYRKFGRRNIAMLTIAPTGTTSIMTQTTSGIEPVFMPYYTRRVKINTAEPGVRVDFVDETGIGWQEHNVLHHGLVQWAEVQGITQEELGTYTSAELSQLVARSPYAGSSANELDWKARVEMQGRLQKWVDHSISVTINLPKDVSEDTVATLYETAWAAGCKGVTVYRDGSRSGVLVSADAPKDAKTGHEEKIVPPSHGFGDGKRPEALAAEVVRFRNGAEEWVAVVGLGATGSPYEIFTGRKDEELLFVPPSIKSGFVRKVSEADGTARYDFEYVNRNGYKVTIPGLSQTFNPEYWNYARLISTMLRYNAPLAKVVSTVEGLQFDADSLNTWKAGVARALKTYIPDGTRAGRCEACGEDALEYTEGCRTCRACGESKCS